MSSSLLVQIIADHVPEAYLPSGYAKSEYTFPFLSVSKTPTGELPVVMVQAKAMYHHLLDAIHGLVQDVELIVPLKGLIDTEAELEKLLKEQAKLEQELGRIQAKLGNEQFTSKAPPQVVAKEREKEDELKARLAKTLESQIRMRNQA